MGRQRPVFAVGGDAMHTRVPAHGRSSSQALPSPSPGMHTAWLMTVLMQVSLSLHGLTFGLQSARVQGDRQAPFTQSSGALQGHGPPGIVVSTVLSGLTGAASGRTAGWS